MAVSVILLVALDLLLLCNKPVKLGPRSFMYHWLVKCAINTLYDGTVGLYEDYIALETCIDTLTLHVRMPINRFLQ